ncbi:MAG: hypothetical protein M1820_000719 [Bogoriella megaspora]|nr:MAG: hypothetical protein M1820_000719 [Bogoriella megaspora]
MPGLLDLPVELRLMVLGYALVKYRGVVFWGSLSVSPGTMYPITYEPRSAMKLLHTWRQIRQETSYLFFSLARFEIDNRDYGVDRPWSKWVRHLSWDWFLDIYFFDEKLPKEIEELGAWLAGLESLETFEMVLHGHLGDLNDSSLDMEGKSINMASKLKLNPSVKAKVLLHDDIPFANGFKERFISAMQSEPEPSSSDPAVSST